MALGFLLPSFSPDDVLGMIFFPLCLFISDLVMAAAGQVMHENMGESGRARLARVRLACV
jgi:hypothetical protein